MNRKKIAVMAIMMKNRNSDNRLQAKPGWLLITNSFFVILLSVTFVCMSVHVLVSDSDDFMELVGIAFLSIGMSLGILQFLATFKKSIMASYIISIFLGIIGLWPVFLLSLSIIDLFRVNSENRTFDIPFSIYCLLTVLYLTFTILLNLRWANIIKKTSKL